MKSFIWKIYLENMTATRQDDTARLLVEASTNEPRHEKNCLRVFPTSEIYIHVFGTVCTYEAEIEPQMGKRSQR